MKVCGVTNAVFVSLPTALIHDWTFFTRGGPYGLTQIESSQCDIWFGNHIATLPFSAPVAAGGLLLIVLLLLFAAWHFIGNLRHRDVPGDG